jgi:hypothetical protein
LLLSTASNLTPLHLAKTEQGTNIQEIRTQLQRTREVRSRACTISSGICDNAEIDARLNVIWVEGDYGGKFPRGFVWLVLLQKLVGLLEVRLDLTQAVGIHLPRGKHDGESHSHYTGRSEFVDSLHFKRHLTGCPHAASTFDSSEPLMGWGCFGSPSHLRCAI